MNFEYVDEAVNIAEFPVEPPNDLEFTVENKQLIAHKDNLEWVGTRPKLDFKYLVGVVNGDKIELHPTKFYQIRPRTASSTGKLIQKDYIHRNQLGEAFGTKKKKQIIKQREINQIDVEMMSVDKIKDSIKTVHVPTTAKLIQPNLDAINPQDCYPIETLIPTNILNLVDIKKVLKLRLDSEIKQLVPRPTSFVTSLISSALKQQDKTRLRQIIFLSYLNKFFKCSGADLNSDDITMKFGGCSVQILDYLRELFCEKDVKYTTTPLLKDKLLAYIICISLTLNEFALEPSIIGQDLGLSGTKITKVGRELGCRTDASKSADGIQRKRLILSLPLVFPNKTR